MTNFDNDDIDSALYYQARAAKKLRAALRCKCHSASEEPCDACSMSQEDADKIEQQLEEMGS